MKALLFLLMLNVAFAAKIVCYYESWAIYYEGDGAVEPEDIDPSLCTHINYAFVNMYPNGSLFSDDDYADLHQNGFKRVVALKEQNPDLKVLLSIQASAQTFSRVAKSDDAKLNMLLTTRWYLIEYGFDGADLDWEYPGHDDKDNFVSLLELFRYEFDVHGWELSAAVSADVQEGYDVPKLGELLDHINVMTYDMYGPWSEYTGQNSPLYASSVESTWEKANLNMDAAITQWLDAGAEPSKVLPGVAFFGHTFTLKDASVNDLHAPVTGGGKGGPIMKEEAGWSYIEFCEARTYWHCRWEEEQKMRICVNGDQWLGIDDEGSIRNKVAFINSHHLGGAMVWSIDQDDVHGSCGDPYPLLHAIADNIV